MKMKHLFYGELFFPTGKTYKDKEGFRCNELIDAFFDLNRPAHSQVLYPDDPLIEWRDSCHFTRPVFGSDGQKYTAYCFVDAFNNCNFYKMVSPNVQYGSETIKVLCRAFPNKNKPDRAVFYSPVFFADGYPPDYEVYRRGQKKAKKERYGGQKELFA
jgi:hypothetical protein